MLEVINLKKEYICQGLLVINWAHNRSLAAIADRILTHTLHFSEKS